MMATDTQNSIHAASSIYKYCSSYMHLYVSNEVEEEGRKIGSAMENEIGCTILPVCICPLIFSIIIIFWK